MAVICCQIHQTELLSLNMMVDIISFSFVCLLWKGSQFFHLRVYGFYPLVQKTFSLCAARMTQHARAEVFISPVRCVLQSTFAASPCRCRWWWRTPAAAASMAPSPLTTTSTPTPSSSSPASSATARGMSRGPGPSSSGKDKWGQACPQWGHGGLLLIICHFDSLQICIMLAYDGSADKYEAVYKNLQLSLF